MLSNLTPSKRSRHLKRLAAVYERKANTEAVSDKPWSLGNKRDHQNRMVDALKERNAIIRHYLMVRTQRVLRAQLSTPKGYSKRY